MLLNGFDCKIKQRIIDPLGRNLGIEAEINDGKYILLNVYGPNNYNEAAIFDDHLVDEISSPLLQEIYTLPHIVSCETYVWSFQYRY